MNIVVSTRSILIALLIFGGIWVSFQIKEFLLLIFVSLIISFALLPFIEGLEKRRFSRFVATLVVYFSVVLVLLILIGSGVSPMIEQTTQFITQLPKIIEAALSSPLISPISRQVVEEATRQLASISVNIVKVTFDIFNSFLSLVTIIVFSFYFSLGYENYRKMLLGFLSADLKTKVSETLKEIENQIGGWVRGEFTLMIVIAAFSYIGLSILRVNYALPLSLIAGVLEIVPVVGPVISAVPAVIVGFATSPTLGIGILALYILIQQFENNLIVPRVMEKAVGLNPLLIMSVIFVGGKIFGIVGGLLAIPIALIFQVILPKFFLPKNK